MGVDKQFANVDKKITGVAEGIREAIKDNTREIIAHFNESQGEQNNRLDEMDAKLDAIMDPHTNR